jgi:hypothetical protein
MSELQNPLFDEEKEFLERKKLEYERALRGDVNHIKDQSVMVGKVALVGAGLAGGVWLVSKLIGGKKRKKKARKYLESDHDDGFSTNYYSLEEGDDSLEEGDENEFEDGLAHKSAAESALAFTDNYEHGYQADDLGFGVAHSAAANSLADESDESDDEEFEEDPFRDLPYDDSRRLPTSHAFDATTNASNAKPKSSRSGFLGSMVQAFLQSDTGKVLVAQAAAVAMALVTKKIGEFFPADKNADLATSPGHASAAAGTVSVASPAPSVSSDAFNPSQSL